MNIIKTTKAICQEFVSKKHYSRNLGIFWEGFGLIENKKIVGVAVYGQPSPSIQKHAFANRDFRLYELTRVVIQTDTVNAASFLISNSLKMLSNQPCAVVSYADMEYGHCGIIYQATNWYYTGSTVSHDKLYLVDGKRIHSMTLREQGITAPTTWAKNNNIEMVKPHEKHRYFMFVGDKREKRKMMKSLNYPIISEYPKCDKRLYDDGEILDIPMVEKNTFNQFFHK
jgi:hypothetical protein